MRIYNNDPSFGDCGPFECPSFEALADLMQSKFETWAREHLDTTLGPLPVTPAQYIAQDVQGMRERFLAGLTQVKAAVTSISVEKYQRAWFVRLKRTDDTEQCGRFDAADDALRFAADIMEEEVRA